MQSGIGFSTPNGIIANLTGRLWKNDEFPDKKIGHIAIHGLSFTRKICSLRLRSSRTEGALGKLSCCRDGSELALRAGLVLAEVHRVLRRMPLNDIETHIL